MFKVLLQNEAGKNLVMYLKQTNLENGLHISIDSPKEDFNDTISQHYGRWVKTLAPVFLCLCSIYKVAMLPFRFFFFMCFPLLLFCINLQCFNPLEQYLFVIFNENLW